MCKILILSGFLLSNAVPEGREQGMKSLVEDHVSSDRPGFLTDRTTLVLKYFPSKEEIAAHLLRPDTRNDLSR